MLGSGVTRLAAIVGICALFGDANEPFGADIGPTRGAALQDAHPASTSAVANTLAAVSTIAPVRLIATHLPKQGTLKKNDTQARSDVARPAHTDLRRDQSADIGNTAQYCGETGRLTLTRVTVGMLRLALLQGAVE